MGVKNYCRYGLMLVMEEGCQKAGGLSRPATLAPGNAATGCCQQSLVPLASIRYPFACRKPQDITADKRYLICGTQY